MKNIFTNRNSIQKTLTNRKNNIIPFKTTKQALKQSQKLLFYGYTKQFRLQNRSKLQIFKNQIPIQKRQNSSSIEVLSSKKQIYELRKREISNRFKIKSLKCLKQVIQLESQFELDFLQQKYKQKKRWTQKKEQQILQNLNQLSKNKKKRKSTEYKGKIKYQKTRLLCQQNSKSIQIKHQQAHQNKKQAYKKKVQSLEKIQQQLHYRQNQLKQYYESSTNKKLRQQIIPINIIAKEDQEFFSQNNTKINEINEQEKNKSSNQNENQEENGNIQTLLEKLRRN